MNRLGILNLANKANGRASGSSSWTPRYYVSNTGNDVSDGLTPETAWQTIAKVNATNFVAGDKIGFQRGGVWRETLIIPSDNVELGAYGSGANPIIDGTDLVSGWGLNPALWYDGATMTYSWYFSTTANYNARNVIAANSSNVDGTKVRMSFKATGGGNAVITGVSIGLMTNGQTFDSAPTRVTFDAGSNSTTITLNTTKVSDLITFAFDRTKRYGIHVFASNRINLSAITDGSVYWGGTGDNTLTLINPGTGPSDGYQMIDKFEVLSVIPNVYDAAVALVIPNEVFKDDLYQTKGVSKSALNNYEWFFTGGVLSYRDDLGSPIGITATLRNTALTTNNKINVVIKPDLIVRYGNYKRFMDNRIANVFGEYCVEPTILLSDDLTRMHIWSNHRYGYTDDGINFHTLVGTDFPAGTACGSVVKDGNTYYMTVAHFGATDYDYINVFSSSNMINWTDLGTIIPIGGAGTWDSTGIGNSFVWKEGGIWYMLYEAHASGINNYKIGLATANTIDGVWTKYAGNPVLDGGSAGEGVGNPELAMINNVVIKLGGYYYMFYHFDNGGSAHNIMRAKSTDLHTWIVEGPILDYRIPPTAPGTSNGDQALVQFKGKSYLFYTNNGNGGGANMHIDVCIDNRGLTELMGLYP